jgi:N-methylhydantoinase A
MEAEGRSLLGGAGVAPTAITIRREADMRYVGQGHEIRVALPDGPLDAGAVALVRTRFEDRYRGLFGRLGPPVPLEIINWRAVVSGPRPELRLDFGASGPVGRNPRKGVRPAYLPDAGGWVETPVYDRYLLEPGAVVDGPAIVEERESTLIIGPGGRGQVDPHRNLVVEAG